MIYLTNNNYLELVYDLKQAKFLNRSALNIWMSNSLKLLKDYRKEQKEASSVPVLPKGLKGVIYIEIGYNGKDEFNKIYEKIEEIMAKNRLSSELSWAGVSKKDLDEMKKFRHALPERINTFIARQKLKIPELTKVGTDMSVPDDFLKEMVDFNIKRLKQNKLKFYIFGHIGNGHLHINIIPKNLKELGVAKDLYKEFAKKAVSCKGSVSAEHGIGKIKKDFLKIQFNEEELSIMKNIKNKLDPDGIFNPDVLF